MDKMIKALAIIALLELITILTALILCGGTIARFYL